jgi:hypothetical protein
MSGTWETPTAKWKSFLGYREGWRGSDMLTILPRDTVSKRHPV